MLADYNIYSEVQRVNDEDNSSLESNPAYIGHQETCMEHYSTLNDEIEILYQSLQTPAILQSEPSLTAVDYDSVRNDLETGYSKLRMM